MPTKIPSPAPTRDTIPSPPPSPRTVAAELLSDFSDEVAQQLRVVEEALDALTILARSMRREADRARSAGGAP